MTRMAHEHYVSFNEFVNQIFEQIASGKVVITNERNKLDKTKHINL